MLTETSYDFTNESMNSWHSLSLSTIKKQFETDLDRGLSSSQVEERLTQYGHNQLPPERGDSVLILFFRQFHNPLIGVLVIICGILLILGERMDAGIIFSVLFFNAIIGTVQEGRAQHTLNALRQFVQTNATVIRDGKELIISDTRLVPGDLIRIQEGEKIPADARIIESNGIRVNEATLTGESLPVDKTESIIKRKDAPISEHINMLFRGTVVVNGNGRAIITETGTHTEIGKISKKIATLESEIPLHQELTNLSKTIIVGAVTISASLFILGTLLGKSTFELFETVVLLGVSVIPEGLPIVMTVVLANGVWRMARRNALVKKLQAVEALGQTDIIAVDKTGTLTKNELVVRKIFMDDMVIDISGSGYEPTGRAVVHDTMNDVSSNGSVVLLASYASLLSNAHIAEISDAKQWRISGDPTEAAMRVFAQKLGLEHDQLEKRYLRLAEIPFDFRYKYHAILAQHEQENLLIAAGAPEVIMEKCTSFFKKSKEDRLTDDERKNLEHHVHTLSSQGYRVICLASRLFDNNSEKKLDVSTIGKLTFLGFLALEDSIREEVSEAVLRAQQAGLHIIMLTGDHRLTAQAIGLKTGIFHKDDRILTGEEIDSMDEDELYDALSKTTVCARVTPDNKLKIIEAFKKHDKIIAMTGDGVNDAPALVAANLGIGMGKIGTEVSKEASDIILLDDNFATIIAAIEEGRRIYRTIRKVILYLLSTNLSEVLAITGAILLNIPLPLVAVQIIWLNFVTDSFLDVALGLEGKDGDLLSSRYSRRTKTLVDRSMLIRIVNMAFPMALSGLYLFLQTYPTDIKKAWTVCLTTLALSQWLNAWNCRSEDKSIFRTNPFSNKFLVAAFVTVLLLQIGVVYLPFMNTIFHTTPLTIPDWFAIVGISLLVILTEEIRKFFSRKSHGTVSSL